MKKEALVLFCVVIAMFLPFRELYPEEATASFAGHTIKVDGSIGDWIGTAPAKPNTAVIEKGEYIWKDETGDDKGNGKYTYPTNKAFAKGADLLEFRVTWDSQNVYFLIKRVRPGDWWIPYCLIGIDEDGARGMKKGAQVLAQGDINSLEADTGAFGELKVMPALACEYVIGISGTYKGRIWDSDGKLVAKTFGEQTDTKGFLIKDSNWSAIEVAIPQSIIGNPAGKTWRFILATGLEENGYVREIYKEAVEWHGGGGEATTAEDGVDPDFYDLAGSDKATQESELGSYNASSPAGETSGFAVIKKSYLTVNFSAMKLASAD